MRRIFLLPKFLTTHSGTDIPFGKSHRTPNGLQKKCYSVREIIPKPERTLGEMLFRSGNHTVLRTDSRRNVTPFGKPPRNPNGTSGKDIPFGKPPRTSNGEKFDGGWLSGR